MQVKKFEAPTMQEALDLVKGELGPEAIILQTKKVRKGFSFNSPLFVEVTAAVSERSLIKKNAVDQRLPEEKKNLVQRLPAHQQASLYEKVMDRRQNQLASKHEQSPSVQTSKRITATRYAEIDTHHKQEEKDHLAQLLDSSSGKKREEKVEWSKPKPQAPGSEALGSNHEKTPSAGEPYAVLQDEVRALRKIIEELKATPSHPSSAQAYDHESRTGSPHGLDTEALQDAFDELVVNGVERRIALGLLKKVAFELGADLSQSAVQVKDALAKEVLESVRVISPLDSVPGQAVSAALTVIGPRVCALVGPTGAGKTSTVVKLASDLQARGHLKIGLMSFDALKATSLDQLGTYSKLLQIPFRAVSSVEDLREALSDFKNLDLILVDTAGKSYRDTEGLREIQSAISAIEKLEVWIVLSATTRDSELYDSCYRYSIFSPQGLIISKLDEVVSYGGVYNLTQKVKTPLAYFTTGQKIPDDLEKATPERLVSLLMDFDE